MSVYQLIEKSLCNNLLKTYDSIEKRAVKMSEIMTMLTNIVIVAETPNSFGVSISEINKEKRKGRIINL
jgi:hypothetical protein